MSITKPATLGIIASPGSEQFTDKILTHLKRIYNRKYDKIATLLSRKYSLTKKQAVEALNLESDLHAGRVQHIGEADKLAVPSFELQVKFTRFANGEFKTDLLSSIRGMEIYIIHDLANNQPIEFNDSGEYYRLSVNDHLLILFATIDAALQAGAGGVTVVMPTYPFARQHRKKGREALSASMAGRLLETMGVKRIITLDIHSKEIENTFQKLRLENLHGSYQILKKLKSLIDLSNEDIAVVSPDTGAVDRNKFYAGNLSRPLALLYKERDYSKISRNASDNNITTMRLLGSVEGKTVFMADDLLDTGGTLIKAMEFLKKQGAREIICAVGLALFNGNAKESFDNAYKKGLFYRIIGTNAVFHDPDLLDREWYEQTDVSSLFAQVIYRLHHNRSLSALLDNRDIIQRLLHE